MSLFGTRMVDIIFISPQPCLLLPQLQVSPWPAVCRLILMPGPDIEMKLMQTLSDVQGCDCWLGNYWEGNQQWWVGWHSPHNLHDWAWPSHEWLLFGYERWYFPRRGEPKVLEAFYATPNPSVQVPPLPLPDGHWHIAGSHNGHLKWQQLIDSPLVEDENLYLKGAALALRATSTLRARAIDI